MKPFATCRLLVENLTEFDWLNHRIGGNNRPSVEPVMCPNFIGHRFRYEIHVLHWKRDGLICWRTPMPKIKCCDHRTSWASKSFWHFGASQKHRNCSVRIFVQQSNSFIFRQVLVAWSRCWSRFESLKMSNLSVWPVGSPAITGLLSGWWRCGWLPLKSWPLSPTSFSTRKDGWASLVHLSFATCR